MINHSLSVTIDIEDWYCTPSVCGSPFSEYTDINEFFEKWTDRYDYISGPTKRILDLLDEFNVGATFFIVADIVKYYPGLVESIVDRGHEIASHGLYHNCKIDPSTKKPLISRLEFEKVTLFAKRTLEKIYGEDVIGYRAPNALVGGWMLDSLKKIGFKYDSSVCVNSFYNKTDSCLKGILSYPYHPKNNSLELGKKTDFIEFPWAYWDIFGLKIPTSGGPMLRFLGAHIVLKGLKQSLKRGHTIFYFHPEDISIDDFPKIGNGRPFYWIIKGKIVERRIRHILKSLPDVKKICLKDFAEELL